VEGNCKQWKGIGSGFSFGCGGGIFACCWIQGASLLRSELGERIKKASEVNVGDE